MTQKGILMNRLRTHIRTNMIGYFALVVALSGTSYAVATVNSADVVDNSLKTVDLKNGSAVKSVDVVNGNLKGVDLKIGAITGREIRTKSVTGRDVYEESLDLSRACSRGLVKGYAVVNTDEFTPVFYSTAPVEAFHNCTGRPVEVRRAGAGNYRVRFKGQSNFIGVATPRGVTGDDHYVSVVSPYGLALDAGALQVGIKNSEGISVDDHFTIVVF